MQLVERLKERRTEIEGSTLARVHAVADPTEVEDPGYTVGLREAVTEALDYAIEALEAARSQGPAPVPERLLGQARSAARSGVSLDTVLRRYSSGYSLLGDFLIAEAEGEVPGEELKRAHRAVSGVFDRLVEGVSEAYEAEVSNRPRTTEQRRAERVRRLLAGELVDSAELGYELDGWHLGAVARGAGALEVLRGLAGGLNCSLLLAGPSDGILWAWFGARSRFSISDGIPGEPMPVEVSLALGEPAMGVDGWRLTHRQARAAMQVVQLATGHRARYAEVAFLASALRDDVLLDSLCDIYLAPLEVERDGGAALRRTLAAYFAAGRNVSSAAAALGVNRKTVSIRLRTVGERIERSVDDCAAELQTALALRELRLNHLTGSGGRAGS